MKDTKVKKNKNKNCPGARPAPPGPARPENRKCSAENISETKSAINVKFGHKFCIIDVQVRFKFGEILGKIH